MNFKIGDHVLVMDEAISGVVTKIEDRSISIETTDGFLLDFTPNELIKVNPKQSLKSEIVSSQSSSSVLLTKSNRLEKRTPKVKPKDRNQPAMEVDLHIQNLTKNDRHMSNYDMLNLQIETAQRQLCLPSVTASKK